jgi:nucleoside-diphosphate-sugar epimerase
MILRGRSTASAPSCTPRPFTAFIVATGRPQDFWAINVDGTFNLYEAATAAKVAKIVLASSMAV